MGNRRPGGTGPGAAVSYLASGLRRRHPRKHRPVTFPLRVGTDRSLRDGATLFIRTPPGAPPVRSGMLEGMTGTRETRPTAERLDIPRFSVSGSDSVRVRGGPGSGLVYMVAEAAVQDADEAVGRGRGGLGGGCRRGRGGGRSRRGRRVRWSGRRRPAGRGRRRGAGCGRSGPARPGCAGGFGDRAHAGVVLAGLGVGVAVGVVAELGEHPGAEDRARARAGSGRSQRPGAGQNPPPPALARTATWAASSAMHRDQRGRRWRRRRSTTPGRAASCSGAQRGLDLLGARLRGCVAARPGAARRDPRPGQRRPLVGGGGEREHRERVPAGQVVAERRQRGRVELAQHRAQRVGLPLPGPDHRSGAPGPAP